MSDAAAPDPHLILVTDDLLFPSRIGEAARPLGWRVVTVSGTPEGVVARVRSLDPAPFVVLVNLNARRIDADAVIRALKSDPATAAFPLVAFAGHVETAKHDAARAAGADAVLANSSVSMHLGKVLEPYRAHAAD